MTAIPKLENLEYLPYLNQEGIIDPEFERKIGVYAVFNQEKTLQFVGYSRDIYLSLKQHLIRKPEQCYWLKVETIAKPSRSLLEEIKQTWLIDQPNLLRDETTWNDPIDTKLTMTETELQEYNNSDELGQIKLLKKIARKTETEINQKLVLRGVKMEIRFNPKLKEKGLLDLK
jgi:hypothetical protein